MRTILKTVLTAGILLSLGVASAQEAKPLPRHPGDVIKYQIVFDGPNAEKIKYVNASLALMVGPPKDQAGFATGIPDNNVQPKSPNIFELSFKVPENASDGDYRLSFSAFADDGSGNYMSGQEFNVSLVHIENPKKFTPPTVKVTPLP
jgi:uncharacterized protein YfaS (alpha-2-macroglobulin family)